MTQAIPTYQSGQVAALGYTPQVYNQQNDPDQAPEDEDVNMKPCYLFCCVGCLMNVFGILAASGVLGNLPKEGAGHRSLSPNNMATSFVYDGSIDGITRDICDGNYKYSVSSSGIIKYRKISLQLCNNALFLDLKTTQILTTQIYIAQISSTRRLTALPSNFSLS